MSQAISRGCNHSVDVPQIFPRLVVLPQEDLPFDQPAIAVELAYCGHFFGGKRLADGAEQVTQYIARIGRKRNGYLAALYSPLDANDRRMHAESLRDFANH